MHKKKSLVNIFIVNIKKHALLYAMLLPVLIYYIVFCYAPMFGLVIAFQDFIPSKGFLGSEFVGFKNFSILFQSADFPMVMKNTILISIYRLLWGFPAPILLALMLNEVRNKHFKKITQTITYMPHFLSWVIAAGLVTTFLSQEGPLNQTLALFGGETKMFLLAPEYFRTILVVSDIWKEVGWGTLLYLAAIAGIDQQQYEAAVLDGAGRFKQIIHITLPAIQGTVIILLILRTGTILNSGFEQVLLLQNPMVRNISEIIDTYVYKIGIEGTNYSFATAVGLFKSVVSFALVLSSNFIARRFGDNSLL